MSPEERARMLRNFVCTHYRLGISAVIGPTSGEFFCEKCVAHEIRAAENDALERVVGVLVGCWCDEYGGMTREEAEATSEVVLIRSLQSKPPEGK